MTETTTPLSERDEVELLLPWYAIGKLDDADRARVDSWLARDKALARQLELIEDDRRATVQSNELKRLPLSLSVHSAMKTIVADSAKTSLSATGLFGQVRRFFTNPTSNGVRWAMATAAAIILFQTVWVGTLLTGHSPAQNQPGQYQTASGGAATAAEGTFALVRFTDTASVKDIAAALSALDMTVTDGPKPGNLFRVRLSAKVLTPAERDTRLAALRSKPELVLLATPATER